MASWLRSLTGGGSSASGAAAGGGGRYTSLATSAADARDYPLHVLVWNSKVDQLQQLLKTQKVRPQNPKKNRK